MAKAKIFGVKRKIAIPAIVVGGAVSAYMIYRYEQNKKAAAAVAQSQTDAMAAAGYGYGYGASYGYGAAAGNPNGYYGYGTGGGFYPPGFFGYGSGVGDDSDADDGVFTGTIPQEPPMYKPPAHKPAAKVAVPNVTHDRAKVARQALRHAGLTYNISDRAVGTVKAQSPKPGTKVDIGSKVSLTM